MEIRTISVSKVQRSYTAKSFQRSGVDLLLCDINYIIYLLYYVGTTPRAHACYTKDLTLNVGFSTLT